MKNYSVKRTALALSLLASGAAGSLAQAQSVIFTNPFLSMRTYGLINTDTLAVYINDRGDIGAPVQSGNAKPNGLLDPNGRPYINADGSVNTAASNNGIPNGTYGLLISETPVPSGGSLGDSVRAKNEYLTVGPSTTAEGFAVFGDDSRLQKGSNWLNASDFTAQPLALASGGQGLVSQLFRRTGTLGQGLQITQTVKPITNSNRLQFDITFTNTDVKTLTGLRYARGINANPGGSLATSTGDTNQFFGSGPNKDPNPNRQQPFAIGSSVGSRQIALTVNPSGANVTGARVTVASEHNEGKLLSNPDVFFDPSLPFITLGTIAKQSLSATFNVGDGSMQTTTNYASDPNFQPDFGTLASGDYGLLLESGVFDLSAGQSTDFIFNLETEPRAIPTGVPEPGAFALLASGLSVGLWLRRRAK